MTLNRKRWLVRWFFWSLGIVDEFTDGYRTRRIEESGTSLCFFFQTIVVFAPLVLLAQAVFWTLLVAAVMGAPIAWFGLWSYLGVVGVIAIIGAALWGINEWQNYRRDTRHDRCRADEEPSDASLAVSWFRAVKTRVCPLITFAPGESRHA